MKRKIITTLLIMSMVLSVPTNAWASNKENDTIVSEKQGDTIDALYCKREQLALDYATHKTEIEQIDQQILNLGAKEISYDDVYSKQSKDPMFGSRSSKAPIPHNGGVKWTDYRKTITVNGKSFELQVITGVPNDDSSPLLGHSLTYQQTPDATYKAVYSLVYSLTAAGAGHVPGLSTIITVATLAKKAYNLTTVGDSVTVSGVNCSASTAATSTMRMVYVKYSGSTDATQRCMYLGNSSSCKTTFTIGYNKKHTNGNYTAENETRKKSFTIQSDGYSDFDTMCWNFYKYKTNGTSFESNHLVRYCKLYYKVKKGNTYTNITNERIKLPVV